VTAAARTLPAWSEWAPRGQLAAWSVGIEEEVTLIDPSDWNLASRVDAVIASAGTGLAAQLARETHGSAIELATAPHRDVPDAAAELRRLRASLQDTLRGIGLIGGAAGMHPFARQHDVRASTGERQRAAAGGPRGLAGLVQSLTRQF
jgi:glutamate---cysteine ligase / carboxylate-amine ligase